MSQFPDAEQLQVQLAGCLTAAEGATKSPAKIGDYGWSLAYEKTLLLRRAFDEISRGRSPEQVLGKYVPMPATGESLQAHLARGLMYEITHILPSDLFGPSIGPVSAQRLMLNHEVKQSQEGRTYMDSDRQGIRFNLPDGRVFEIEIKEITP